jgi:aryl-alcohol dehydrogenase-like predicted oxidoreductase
MQTRRLGDGLEVSALGYGALDLSPGVYGDVSEEEGLAALGCALDLGVTLIDTSDQYGLESHNEQLVGRALCGRRDEVVIATKFGLLPVPGESGRVPDRFRHRPAPGQRPARARADIRGGEPATARD